MTVRTLALAAALTLAVTGCATAYGAKGLTGGYSDERIDDTHYLVSFQGNGHASKERVWNFWFYRCAELTLEKGFAYFDLESKDKKQSLIEQAAAEARYAAARDGARGIYAPAAFIYTTVTTWNSSAIVAMYATVPAGKVLLSAKRVMEQLGPYVAANGGIDPPERKSIFRGALMKPGASGEAVRLVPDGVTIGFVDMQRVLNAVSEGKAARARLKASFAKKQAALDGAKAQVDALRKAFDAEQDPARKAKLETDLAAQKKASQELLARLQAEVNADEKRELAPLRERINAVVERVRSANKLDTMSEDGTFWDKDITAEVVKAYEEKYAVPAST